jgi:hypothetical protein
MEFTFVRNGYLGFFSDCFRFLHTYMVCKKNGDSLYINSSDWNYGNWNDYFVKDFKSPDIPLTNMNWDNSEDRQFTVADYKKAIQEVFVYQPHILERVESTLLKLGLHGKEDSTVAIYIRRGDKLLGEAVLIPTDIYVRFALVKNPSHIFVQTDDYRAFLEVQTIVNSLAPHISVHTTCPPQQFGMYYEPLNVNKAVSVTYNVNGETLINDTNIQYLKTITQQKPILEYTYDEIKESVEEMITGVLICQRVSYVVLDHMSNVSRFIVFSHPGGKERILSIEDLNLTINNSSTRVIPPYQYTDDKYIRNPRFHSIYNEYI